MYRLSMTTAPGPRWLYSRLAVTLGPSTVWRGPVERASRSVGGLVIINAFCGEGR